MTALAATLGLAFRGRPAKYHRDAGCVAQVNVAQVEDLLQERTELRRARDFGSADRVLENLREMGVAVDDDARSWFVGGSRKWQRPDGNRREQAARHSREQVQKDARARRKTPKKPAKAKVDRDAPYARSASCAATLSDAQAAEIGAVVAERLAAKRSRRYAAADALLAELGQQRVCVSDETREWRADGGTFAAEYAQKFGGAAGRGEATPAATLGVISTLLQARSLSLSLALTLPLTPTRPPRPNPSSEPGRFINADPNLKPGPNPESNPNPDPNPNPNPKPDPDPQPNQARALAKSGRDYPKADDLLDEMLDLGVLVDDRQRVWQHGQTAPLAVPQLGSCATSGRAWRLWAAQHSQGEAQPLGARPPPWVLEPAASKAADVTAVDHAGVAPRRDRRAGSGPSRCRRRARRGRRTRRVRRAGPRL